MRIDPLETITRMGLFDCALSPDGQRVAAVFVEDDGQRLGIWSTAGCDWLMDLGLTGPYARPCFSPDNRRLAAVQEKHRLLVWSLPEGQEILAQDLEEPITAHAFGPDGEIVVAQGNRLSMWNVDHRTFTASMIMPADIDVLATTGGGRTLGAGLHAGGAMIIDLEGQETIASLPGITLPVSALGFHPSQPLVLAATSPFFAQVGGRWQRQDHGWAEIWNYRTGERITRVPCDYYATLLGQGRYLATLTDNSRSLWIWEIAGEQVVAHIENAVPERMVDDRGHEIRQVTLTATPQGDIMAVAGLTRPISAVGTLRLFAFSAEAAPQPETLGTVAHR